MKLYLRKTIICKFIKHFRAIGVFKLSLSFISFYTKAFSLKCCFR